MLAELRARRDAHRRRPEPRFRACRAARPAGAFYAFPNVSAVPLGAEALAMRLLEDAGVAVLAGSAFGAAGAEHLRVSYATSPELLEEAFERMRALLEGLASAA